MVGQLKLGGLGLVGERKGKWGFRLLF